MKVRLTILIPLFCSFIVDAQRTYTIDTSNVSRDSSGVMRLVRAAALASFTNPEEGRLIAKKAILLAKEIGYKKGEAEALTSYGETFNFSGDFPTALKIQFEALQINKELKDSFGIAEVMGTIGLYYHQLKQYRQGLAYLQPASNFFQRLNGAYRGSFELATIAQVYLALKMNDSARYYGLKALELFTDDPSTPHLKQFVLRTVGSVYAQSGNTDSALVFYRRSILISRGMDDRLNTTTTETKMANLFVTVHDYDSALWYAKSAFNDARSISAKFDELEATELLVKLYQQKQEKDSVLFYLTMAFAAKDSLYGPEKVRQLQLLALGEQQRQQEILREHEQYKARIKYITLLAVIAASLLLSFTLYKRNKRKQHTNLLLQRQKQKVESTLSELRSTQQQLIQSEKMASLGELTAGIAHEIQNPLNFVNNFSEVNEELIKELKAEAANGNLDDVKTIVNDIASNSEKINHHGKRAEAIVKSMLLHSRTSSGQKELTDINALCDEYLRLAYHGLRAKDKSFSAEIETEFDNSVGKMNIVPQEIGRILLNLVNNAFYAVSEKTKVPRFSEDGYEFEPVVKVTTKRAGDKVLISVADNGNGIPQNIVDKIFQPFFTTKPTGQGTGLGLSLAYDIIKAHGGEIRVNAKEGEGSEFTIELPN